jgi:hypothetical protein
MSSSLLKSLLNFKKPVEIPPSRWRSDPRVQAAASASDAAVTRVGAPPVDV